MPNGKVYDPLIGQWMTPSWENVLERVATPTHLHLYRFNGNDPINVGNNRERPRGKRLYCLSLKYTEGMKLQLRFLTQLERDNVINFESG